jgi:hypothetical protein
MTVLVVVVEMSLVYLPIATLDMRQQSFYHVLGAGYVVVLLFDLAHLCFASHISDNVRMQAWVTARILQGWSFFSAALSFVKLGHHGVQVYAVTTTEAREPSVFTKDSSLPTGRYHRKFAAHHTVPCDGRARVGDCAVTVWCVRSA